MNIFSSFRLITGILFVCLLWGPSFLNAAPSFNFYIPLSKKEDPKIQAFIKAFKASQSTPISEISYKDQSLEEYQAVYDLIANSLSDNRISLALVTSDFFISPDGDHYKGITVLGAFPDEPYQLIALKDFSQETLTKNIQVGYVGTSSAVLWAASINPHFQFKPFSTQEEGYTALEKQEISLLILPIESTLSEAKSRLFKVVSTPKTPFKDLYIITSQKITKESQQDFEKSLNIAFDKIEQKSFLSSIFGAGTSFISGKKLEELFNAQKPLMTALLRKTLPELYARGYTMDVPYETYYISNQSPFHIAYALSSQGFEHPSLNKPFTYLDLGTGQGFTVNLLAALYPESEFWGVDLNHDHIESAKAFAEKHNLSNAHFIEAGFAELDLNKLPPFDFITLHGVWTWVDPQIQHQILEVVQSFLKPTGVFYISYNTLPGWSSFQPIAVLIKELATTVPGNSIEKFKKAFAEALALKNAGASFFETSPEASSYLDKMIESSDFSYLSHEYLNERSVPRYFQDVADSLKKISLQFGASTSILHSFPEVFLSPEKYQIFKSYERTPLAETIKDFLWNTCFRWDIFVSDTAMPVDQDFSTDSFYYGILENGNEEDTVSMGDYTFDLKQEPYKDILLSLKQETPKTFQEIYESSPSLLQQEKKQIFYALQVLLEAKRIYLFQKRVPNTYLALINQENQGSQRFKISSSFNRKVIEESSKASKDFSIVSPTLGDAYVIASTTGVFLNALDKATPGKEVEWIYEFYKSNNLPLPEGAPTSPKEEHLFLKDSFESFLRTDLRNMVILGIIEPTSNS